MRRKPHTFRITLLSFILITCTHHLEAQQSSVKDLFIDYERILQVEGVLPVHSVSNQPFSFEYLSTLDTLSHHPWNRIRSNFADGLEYDRMRVELYDPELKSFWRSIEPGGINNGAVWEGRGLTSAFFTGFYLRYHFLSAAIRPVIMYNQNQDFLLSRYPIESDLQRNSNQRSQFSNPLGKIDTPQRFGSSPFWTFDPGPSYLKADFKGFEAGLSNQNRWWGPALHYPIIMGNNAPGFWHFFAGTQEPKDIYIGDLETTFLWGKLIESDYFDQQSYNDERYITGMTMSFTPRPLSNFTVGFSRVFVRTLPPEGIPVGDLFVLFSQFTKSKFVSNDDPAGNDAFDQMISFFGRWVFPESGFEIYAEWARNDHSWNLRDALGEPEHSRGYTLGFQKTHTIQNGNIIALNFEMVQLETTKASTVRPTGSYYAHSRIWQGYTNRGQVIGVGTGPGSNSQLIKGKYFFKKGRLAAWFRRTVYNNDYLYRSAEVPRQPGNLGLQKFWLHNFELGVGSSLVLFFNRWETELGIELMRELNDDYIYKNDQTHLAVSLRLRYRLSGLR